MDTIPATTMTTTMITITQISQVGMGLSFSRTRRGASGAASRH
jgi:hypothetical protein